MYKNCNDVPDKFTYTNGDLDGELPNWHSYHILYKITFFNTYLWHNFTNFNEKMAKVRGNIPNKLVQHVERKKQGNNPIGALFWEYKNMTVFVIEMN